MIYHQHAYALALAALLTPRTRWLDLGAGTRLHGGWQSPTAAELARIARPIGCDLLPRHLRQHPHLAAAVTATGQALPFADQSLDLVTANMTIEHLPDPLAVLQEVRRVLKPGGRFLCVTPNRRHPAVALLATLFRPGLRRLVARILEPRRDPAHIFPTFYRANTRGRLQDLCWTAGLEGEVTVFRSTPTGGWLARTVLRLACWPPAEWFGSNLLGLVIRR